MARTYTEMINLIETILIDAGINPGGAANQIFATAELDELIKKGLPEYSRYRPYKVKHTLTTAASYDFALTDEAKRNLLWIENLEYKVDQDPKSFHNFTRFGDIVTMELGYKPPAGESVYLYLAKCHILQKEVGTSDLLGAIKTQAAIGATSAILKSLGTGTINENTKLTIAGDTTVYTVTTTATIGTNEATVIIYPALAALAAVDAVVTLSLHESTLDIQGEDLLAELVAARAAVNNARKYIGGVDVSGANSAQLMLGWGQNKMNETLASLRRLAAPRKYTLYARS